MMFKRSKTVLIYQCHELLNFTESESYVTTDGQSASLSWNKAPIWGLRLDFYYCQTVAGLLMWSVLSDERTGLSYNCCLPSQAQSFSGLSPVGLATIFYCLRFETSLFVASYDSQGYGGGIRLRLHTGGLLLRNVIQGLGRFLWN
jgi:hypothetical protein